MTFALGKGPQRVAATRDVVLRAIGDRNQRALDKPCY